MIYRGYDIDPAKEGGFVIKLDGKVVSTQPSMGLARQWVNEEKRRLANR